MKRLTKTICIVLALCLMAAGLVFAEGEEEETEDPASQAVRSDDSTYLWIGLQYGSSAVDKITVRSADGFLIVKGNNKGWTQTDITTDSTTLTIVPSGG